MRKFKFFALAFAALSFAACSDDAIDGQGGNTGTTGDGTPAYLTISFSANSGSSTRADNGSNTGDSDGNEEDSKHYNTGTKNERTVNTALVVVAPADGGSVGFAKLYTTENTTGSETDGFKIVDQTSGTYVNTEPIKVAVGQYNVLVVANPVSALTTGRTGLNAGITNLNDVEDLYNTIVNGNYAPDETVYKNIANGGILTSGDSNTKIQGIMMANKALNASNGAYSVELDESDTPENPATVTIEVERVYSKVTFREQEITEGESKLDANIYPVEVNTGTVTADIVEGAIAIPSTDPVKYRKVTLNVAHDGAETPHTVYALYEAQTAGAAAEFVGAYADTKQTTSEIYDDADDTDATTLTEPLTVYTALTPITKAEDYKEGTNYVVADDSNPEASLTLLSKEDPEKSTWYVKLEGYALVNLSKGVHYVRQITTAQGHAPFGTLNGNNFLYTTNWETKNSIDLTATNPDFSTAAEGFWNPLEEVSKESRTLVFEGNNLKDNSGEVEYFVSLSSLVDETTNNSGTIHGSGSESPAVGKRMAYLFENSTDIDHQVHGLSTGIAFVARIYKDASASQPIDKLYYYADHTYESLEAILNAYGEGHMSESFKALVEKEKASQTITQEDLNKLADDPTTGGEEIILYSSNTCYYYTTEIKHYDNGDNAVLGNMEYAIMRNNIYSLAVTEINEIGAPFVDPTPNTPNETGEAALNVEAKILPWIVRYNDIEF